jgi:Holliday junction resolvasome RuvABC endonuclease subunit
MIVLGLDPSLTAYGWAIVDRDVKPPNVIAAGCIRTEKDGRKQHMYQADQDAQRIVLLAHGIGSALQQAMKLPQALTQPVRVVCEAPAGAQHATAAKALGQSLGVTLGVLVTRGVGVRFVQAHEVKRSLGGAKDASKDAVAAGVLARAQWASTASTKPAREAEADAAAVALTLTLEELRS